MGIPLKQEAEQHVNQMLDGLPPGPLQTRVKDLRSRVADVEARLANGESGGQIVKDSAQIFAEYKALAKDHPTFGRLLQDPQLRKMGEGPQAVTTPHLSGLDVEVSRTMVVDVKDFRKTIKGKENAVYILRDSCGAVLKVGVAKNGKTSRFAKYLTAANNLGLKLELEIAVVTPKKGKTIEAIETDLRVRLEDEGHVLPWDNARRNKSDLVGRLGREGQGTPFVRKPNDLFAWTKDGQWVDIPQTIAQMRLQGIPDADIVTYLDNLLTVSKPNIETWFDVNKRPKIVEKTRIAEKNLKKTQEFSNE